MSHVCDGLSFGGKKILHTQYSTTVRTAAEENSSPIHITAIILVGASCSVSAVLGSS